MNQLEREPHVVYLEREYQPPYQPPPQQPVVIVTNGQPTQRRGRPPYEVMMFMPFFFAVGALMIASFIVDDVRWLVQRSAAAVVILFLAGMAGTVVLSVWFGIRSFFRGDWLQ